MKMQGPFHAGSAALIASAVIILTGCEASATVRPAPVVNYARYAGTAHIKNPVINETLLLKEKAPTYLPAANHYPKPSFFGAVKYIKPSWNGESALPNYTPPVWENSPPIRDFTITQSWVGKLDGQSFVLDTYQDFQPNNPNADSGSIIGLRYGSRVSDYYSQQGMSLVGFYGNLAVWYSASLGQIIVLDISSGKLVQQGETVASLVFPSYPPDIKRGINQNWYKWVHGIKEQVEEYKVSETLQMALGGQTQSQQKKYALSAWRHRLAVG